MSAGAMSWSGSLIPSAGRRLESRFGGRIPYGCADFPPMLSGALTLNAAEVFKGVGRASSMPTPRGNSSGAASGCQRM